MVGFLPTLPPVLPGAIACIIDLLVGFIVLVLAFVAIRSWNSLFG